MQPSRKRRSDSVLWNLPEATRNAIYALEAVEHLSLDAIHSRVTAAEPNGFEVKVSRSALAEFLSEVRRERILAPHLENIREASAAASTIVAQSDGVNWTAALRESAAATLMDARLRGATTEELTALVNTFVRLATVENDNRALELRARMVVLNEKKAAAFDQLKNAAAAPGGITPETLDEIQRRLGLL